MNLSEEQIAKLKEMSEKEYLEITQGEQKMEQADLNKEVTRCMPVKIGHKIFHIHSVEPTNDNLYMEEDDEYVDGTTMLREEEINIANDLSKSSELETEIHQILHAMEHVYKFEIGEDVTDRLACALTAFIIDNRFHPEMIADDIFEALDENDFFEGDE